MEIARAAARLFVTHGLRATRAEDIAQAAGVAPRTFYRYFAAKEEAVSPLYAAGARRWTDAVRDAPAGLAPPDALEHAARQTLTPGSGVSAASWEWVRTLVRLADSSPALRRVWAEACHTAETDLAAALAHRLTDSQGGSVAVQGAVGDQDQGVSADGTVCGEDQSASAESVAADRGGDTVARGAVGGDRVDGAPGVTDGYDNVAADLAVSPRIRFAAAVAGAAVRVAVEAWAEGTAEASGAQGPAETAVRNLGAVREFLGAVAPGEDGGGG
ncbi:helix-turn-helix transcriptional regulator [Streptomyces actuosus]|uniref:Helix-turn-helix transcriptional regulator n=1 Tax=Streptomyces actuosus TaxID=1885 RepID=A0ABS2W1B9_STRAS|nr:helix-turn-helix transcriptional regulator [Streptomyces actuosus]